MEAMVVMVVVRFEWMMQMLHSRRASGTEGRFEGGDSEQSEGGDGLACWKVKYERRNRRTALQPCLFAAHHPLREQNRRLLLKSCRRMERPRRGWIHRMRTRSDAHRSRHPMVRRLPIRLCDLFMPINQSITLYIVRADSRDRRLFANLVDLTIRRGSFWSGTTMRSDGVVPIRMVRGHPWIEHQHHGSSRVVDRRAHGFTHTTLLRISLLHYGTVAIATGSA